MRHLRRILEAAGYQGGRATRTSPVAVHFPCTLGSPGTGQEGHASHTQINANPRSNKPSASPLFSEWLRRDAQGLCSLDARRAGDAAMASLVMDASEFLARSSARNSTQGFSACLESLPGMLHAHSRPECALVGVFHSYLKGSDTN